VLVVRGSTPWIAAPNELAMSRTERFRRDAFCDRRILGAGGAVVWRGLTLGRRGGGEGSWNDGLRRVGMIQSTQGLSYRGGTLGLAATKFVAESRRSIPQEQGATSPWDHHRPDLQHADGVGALPSFGGDCFELLERPTSDRGAASGDGTGPLRHSQRGADRRPRRLRRLSYLGGPDSSAACACVCS